MSPHREPLNQSPSGSRRWLGYLPRLIGLGILAWILFRVGPGVFWHAILRVGAPVFALLIVLDLVHLFCKSARWRVLLATVDIRLGHGTAFASYLAGIAMGSVTPGRAGEFFRAWIPVRAKKGTLPASLATVLVDRLHDLLLLLVGSAMAVLFLFRTHWLWMGVAFGILLGLAGFFVRRRLGAALGILCRKLHIRDDQWSDFSVAFRTSLKSWPVPLAWTLAGNLLMHLQVFLLARAVGSDISFPVLFVLFSLANTVALLPVSFLGLGTREAVLGMLFVAAGQSEMHGIAVGLGFFLLVSVPVSLTGGLFLLFPGWMGEKRTNPEANPPGCPG